MFYTLLVCIIMCRKQLLQKKKTFQFSTKWPVDCSAQFEFCSERMQTISNEHSILNWMRKFRTYNLCCCFKFISSIKSYLNRSISWTGKIVVATQRVPFISVYSWHTRYWWCCFLMNAHERVLHRSGDFSSSINNNTYCDSVSRPRM